MPALGVTRSVETDTPVEADTVAETATSTEAGTAETGERGRESGGAADSAPHVCMLLPGAFPPDVRVRKEIDALRTAGYRVTVVASGPAGRPARETVAGASVVRLDRTTRRGRLGWLASAAVNLPTAVHPIWLVAVRRLHRRDAVDVLHVHDLPLGGTALLARRLFGIPVVLDLHENYPEAVLQWRRTTGGFRTSPLGWLKHRLYPRSRWKRLERRWVRRADHILTVVREAREHYLRDCGADSARVTVVSNTVELSRFTPDDPVATGASPDPVAAGESGSTVAATGPDSFTVSYVGGFGPHRGLDTAVRAVAALDERVSLLLVGGGGGTTESDIRALVDELGVRDRVTITGWVDFDEVPGYVGASDVCLVPHASSPHTETTVPHKLFQYMAMQTPVVVTDVAPLARVVRETESGLMVPAGDHAAMADAIRRLCDDVARRAELGRNGRAAVETEYNWDRDAARLVAVYDELCGRVRADRESAVRVE
jgi:glycosyltransferase involved in cell wall biosynthesis